MALSQSSVLKLYHSVIEDVITGVRDSFLDEGVDEQVLQELKQIWESKLVSSKAIDSSPDPSEMVTSRNSGVKMSNIKKNVGSSANDALDGRSIDSVFQQDTSGNLAQRNEKLYPVQITLPAQQGTGETGQRVLTIQVPESAITGNQLQAVLTGPLIGATLSLPTALATTLLQQHVTAALRGNHAGSLLAPRQSFNSGGTGQVDGTIDFENEDSVMPSTSSPQPQYDSNTQISIANFKLISQLILTKKLKQTDGGIDTSDEDDDDDDDDDIDEDDDDKDEDQDEGEGGAEDEPLNSGDDVSEEDVSDLFDTDNVVVCQYDKVTRSRNRWKFFLKDGIMNLSGKDFVFQKSNGDAEW